MRIYLFSLNYFRSTLQGKGGRFCTGPVSFFLLFFIIICSSFFFCLNFLFSSLCLSLFSFSFFLIIACCFASSPPTPSSNSCCVKKRPPGPRIRRRAWLWRLSNLYGFLFCSMLFFLPPTIDDPPPFASTPLFNFSSCLARAALLLRIAS